jgi:hypothetical protein
MPRTRTPAIDRFWTHVKKTDTCWLWTANTNHKGYGLFRNDDQQMVSVHRWAYEQFIGPTGGLDVLHRCDIPNCVQPKCLFLGTNQDNVDDKMAKGRFRCQKGAEHHATRFEDDDIRHIRSASSIVSGGMLAELYGVSQGTISQIRTGKRFKEVV